MEKPLKFSQRYQQHSVDSGNDSYDLAEFVPERMSFSALPNACEYNDVASSLRENRENAKSCSCLYERKGEPKQGVDGCLPWADDVGQGLMLLDPGRLHFVVS